MFGAIAIVLSPFIWLIERIWPEKKDTIKANNFALSRLSARSENNLPSTEDQLLAIISNHINYDYSSEVNSIEYDITRSFPCFRFYRLSSGPCYCAFKIYDKSSIQEYGHQTNVFDITTYSCQLDELYVRRMDTTVFRLNFNSNVGGIIKKNGRPISNINLGISSGAVAEIINRLILDKAIEIKKEIKKPKEIGDFKNNEFFVRSMDWRAFEEWIAYMLNLNGYKAYTTASTNDGGKDIIAQKDGETYYIECKHWRNESSIGRELVQKLVGSAVGANVKRAIFIATCPYNDNAKEYAKQLNAAGMITLELWGMKEILSLANSKNVQDNEDIVRLPSQEETLEQNLFPTQDTYSEPTDDERYDYYNTDSDTDTEEDIEFDDLDLTADEVKEILAEASLDDYDDDDDQAQLGEDESKCNIPDAQLNELMGNCRTDVEEKDNLKPEFPTHVTQPQKTTTTVQTGLPGFENETLKEEDIIALLKNYNIKYVDKRPFKGALWILGGVELKPVVEEARKLGFYFTFKKDGGKTIKGKDCWWAK